MHGRPGPTMSGVEGRLQLIAELLHGGTGIDTKRVCDASAEVTGATGAGIMLMSGDIPRGPVCTTDEVSARIEELQFDLGEGPCVDAYRQDCAVLEPDLERPVSPRWPAFSGPAVDAGARAVFGFPLRVGSVRLGALNLYRDRAGPLSDVQQADALVMADLAAQSLLTLQADAPPGEVGVALESHANFQYVVHQASGMVAAQLEVPVETALIRLRAHTFGNSRRLTGVARDVVARRLRFDAQSGENDPTP